MKKIHSMILVALVLAASGGAMLVMSWSSSEAKAQEATLIAALPQDFPIGPQP